MLDTVTRLAPQAVAPTNAYHSIAESHLLSQIEVRPVRTRREKKRFLDLPWKLYRDNPYWVPPLRLNQKELVNYKRHPFYDDAEICTFLAYRGGVECGRIAAIHNRAHNRTHPDQERGFVGFFECVDDQTVANALFDAAKDWSAERGLTNLRGPTNPSLNYECGLLIDSFDRSPTFMMTYNHEYYPKLWEQYGFEKAQDLLSFVGHVEDLSTMRKKVHFVAQEATKRLNLKLRPVDMRHFHRDVRAFLDLYNESLGSVWGHVNMSDAEVRHMSAGLKHLIVPSLTVIAEVDGLAIGAVLGLLDYNPIIKQIDGRLFPFGFLKLLRERKQIKRVRLMSTNVRKEYQMWGVGVVLSANLVPSAMEWGMQEGEFSWVLESNHLSRKSLERGELAVEKKHRIYDYFGDQIASTT